MIPNQLDIDFSAHRENNPYSQQILDSNIEKFNGQCKTIYQALISGEKLTTTSALLKYSVGDLRRRIKDLRDAGVPIQDELQENRFKIYFIKQAS
jgi:hypothetical protein